MKTIITILVGMDILLMGIVIVLAYRLNQKKAKVSPAYFVLLGMSIGAISGLLTSFNLDSSKRGQ